MLERGASLSLWSVFIWRLGLITIVYAYGAGYGDSRCQRRGFMNEAPRAHVTRQFSIESHSVKCTVVDIYRLI